MFQRQSLKSKIVGPLLALVALILTLAAAAHILSFRRTLSDHLQQNAERIASTIHFIAGSARSPAELRHIVGALGAEPGVNAIILAAGRPAQIVASTRLALLKMPVHHLADPDERKQLETALVSSSPIYQFHKNNTEFDYSRSVQVVSYDPGGQSLQPGALVVHLDARPFTRQFHSALAKIAGYYLATLVALGFASWLLLKRHILDRVEKLSDAVTRFRAGHPPASDKDASADELSQLASAWNTLVERLALEESGRSRMLDEREQLLAQLQSSLELYEYASRASHETLWDWNVRTNILRWGDGLERHLGYSRAQIDSSLEWWEKHVHPHDLLRVTASIKSAYANHAAVWESEYRFRRSDGAYAEILDQACILYDPAGTPTRMIGAMTDITARKRSERSLQESEAKFRSLAETTPAATFIHQGGRYRFVNKVFQDLMGYTGEELLNMDFWEVVHPDVRETVKARGLARARGELVPPEYDFKILTKNGQSRWVEIRAASCEFEGRTAVLATLFDITDRKQAQADLENLHQQLLDASRKAGMAEVATNILHNIGNVLNSVVVSVGQLESGVRKIKAPTLTIVADMLTEHADHLPEFLSSDPKGSAVPLYLKDLASHLAQPQVELLNELASLRKNVDHICNILVKQQAYAASPNLLQVVALDELIKDALQLNAANLHRRDIQVLQELEPIPKFPTDKHRILQILMNLLSNAKNALAPSRPSNQIHVRLHSSSSNSVKISVSDNGVGIAPENLPRIFQHGFTTRPDGHGFGLHYCALAAKEMGGSLSVQSAGPNLGATFTLELPIRRAAT